MINPNNGTNGTGSNIPYQNAENNNADIDNKVEVTFEDVIKELKNIGEEMKERNRETAKDNLRLEEVSGQIQQATNTIADFNELNRNRNRQARQENDRTIFERIGTGLGTFGTWIASCVSDSNNSNRNNPNGGSNNL